MGTECVGVEKLMIWISWIFILFVARRTNLIFGRIEKRDAENLIE
jgi:hypothetical protein